MSSRGWKDAAEGFGCEGFGCEVDAGAAAIEMRRALVRADGERGGETPTESRIVRRVEWGGTTASDRDGLR
jgi:hypothetical protein